MGVDGALHLEPAATAIVGARRPDDRLRGFDRWTAGPATTAASRTLPTCRSYFPIGVWLECLNNRGNVNLDKDVGLNVYVAVCATGQSALNLAAQTHAGDQRI